jgi:hypothetical protein
MYTPSKAIRSAAMLISLVGGGVSALASEHNGQDHTYGGPVQTWCDVNPDCNGWNKGLRHTSYDASAPALQPSPAQKQHPVRKHGRETGNH